MDFNHSGRLILAKTLDNRLLTLLADEIEKFRASDTNFMFSNYL